MKRVLVSLALAAASVFCCAQTHTFPALDTNNTYTGTNIFSGPLQVTGGLGSLGVSQTVTASTVSTPAFHITRIDNSPPAAGAGILNAYLAPMFRIDLITQSGGVTGSHTGFLVNMPSVKGKEITTTTQIITGSGIAQSVSVSDSSVFTIGEVATIDLNKGSAVTEFVTITGIADSTHVTGVFAKNHSSGAKIYVATKGDKIGIGVSIGDQAGNTANTFAENLNVIAVSSSPHWYLASEFDVTNSMGVEPGTFVGDSQPFVGGLSVANAGANNSSAGIIVTTANNVNRFLNGIIVESSKNNGLLIDPGPNSSPTNGIAVQGAITAGVIIGSNQTAGSNPSYTMVDPVDGLYLTSKGSAANASSNTINLESFDSGAVKHNFQIQHGGNAKRIDFVYDAVTSGVAINFDGSVQTQNQFQVRDSGTNTVRGLFQVSGTSSILQSTIMQTDSANKASSGNFRLGSADTFAWRNNANTANLALTKSSTDVINWAGIPTMVFVTADFTLAANTSLQNITGLNWTLPANAALSVPFSCHLMYSQATAAVAAQFGIQDVTVAPTNIAAKSEVYISTSTLTTGNLPTLNTTTASAIVTFTPSATATVFNANIDGLIEQPSNASTSVVSIMAQTSNAADLITVKRGSFCRVF